VFKVGGDFVTDNAAACNAAVLAGLGVGSAQYWQIREQVAEGTLRLLLTQFEPAPLPVHLVWPAAKQLTARTRHFVDFLGKYLSPIIT
jgi:DNA-binding transcriptional LysR family regulator